MEEDIMILESECYYLEELGYLRENNHFIRFNQALENLIKGYRELDKDNNDLRRLYRRTAVKLKENGHEELANYFFAQINEVPTFVVEDDIDYYAEYYKMKTKIRQLEEFKKQVTEIESTNFIKYKNYIPKSKIKEKIEELKMTSSQINGDYFMNNYKIEVLQELMEDKK